MRLLDFIGLTVSFFIIFYFGDKGSAFWKAVICEKGKHSELRRLPFSRSSPPGHAAVLRCDGVNVLTGCRIRRCRGGEAVPISQIVLPFSDLFFVSNCRLPRKHCIVPSDVPALHRSCTGHKIPVHSR